MSTRKSAIGSVHHGHRACINEEHDPSNGKLSGYCVICGTGWPCETEQRWIEMVFSQFTHDGYDRMNRMLSDLWNFMVREDLIDEKLAEEAGPANDHESRGRLNIAQVAERVMARQKRIALKVPHLSRWDGRIEQCDLSAAWHNQLVCEEVGGRCAFNRSAA